MDGQCYTRTVKAMKPKVKYQYFIHRSKKLVTDKDLLVKLNTIKIPPTYKNVMVCPNPKNSLQGIGYDSTGRKQYFYSEAHKERAARQKYCKLVHLGKKVHLITKDINRLMGKGIEGRIDQDVMDALALKVMILCNFRVGSRNNRNKYNTYGLTTITKKHLTMVNGGTRSSGGARIKFIGKKKQVNECLITDKQTVKFLKKLKTTKDSSWKGKDQELKPLFNYKGYTVTPESLNDFLYRYSPNVTTKTWRTWFANIGFIEKMFKIKEIPGSHTGRKKVVNQKIKEIAEELHHTTAVNKKNYLIKELPDIFIEHPDAWVKLKEKKRTPNAFMMEFLQGYCILYKNKGINKANGGGDLVKTKKAISKTSSSDSEYSSEEESNFDSSSDDDSSVSSLSNNSNQTKSKKKVPQRTTNRIRSRKSSKRGTKRRQ